MSKGIGASEHDTKSFTHTALVVQLTAVLFLKGGLLAGGAAVGAGLLTTGPLARCHQSKGQSSGGPSMRRMSLSSVFWRRQKLIESDLWTQYAELGGIGNNPPIEVDPNQC